MTKRLKRDEKSKVQRVRNRVASECYGISMMFANYSFVIMFENLKSRLRDCPFSNSMIELFELVNYKIHSVTHCGDALTTEQAQFIVWQN